MTHKSDAGAFTAAFRARLADAVTVALNVEGADWRPDQGYLSPLILMPLTFLDEDTWPRIWWLSFTDAYTAARDDGTPEARLGLEYRHRALTGTWGERTKGPTDE